jgi:hypothetical protein
MWVAANRPAAPVAHRYSVDQQRQWIFSPDGKSVVHGGQSGLEVKSVTDNKWTSVRGTELAAFPFWAPDASAIGFFSQGRLKMVLLNSHEVRNLADAPSTGGTWREGSTTV